MPAYRVALLDLATGQPGDEGEISFDLAAGWAVATVRIPITTSEFAAGARSYFQPFQLFFSVMKGGVFGVSIAFIACASGLRATGGAAGVGRATTVSVVVGTVTMMILDLLLARLLRVFG